MKKVFVVLFLAMTLGLAGCSVTGTSNSGSNPGSDSTSVSNPGPSSTSVSNPGSSSASVSNPGSDSTSVSNPGSSSASVSTPVVTNSWSDDAKSVMNEVIGEELPFVELKADYSCTKEADEYGDFVQIYDEDSVNHLANYGDILESNGYAYDSEETVGGVTDYYYIKGDIVVQYHFAVSEGNTIFAWLESVDDPVEQPTVQTTDTAWPSDLKALMVDLLQEELPFVALADNYQYESNQIYIYDTSNVNYLTEYGDTLVRNGYELAFSDDSSGYPIHEYVKYLDDNTVIVVDFDYYPGDEYNDACNEIAARLSHFTDTWPSDAIASVIGADFGTKVPEFAVTSGYEYYCSTDAIIIAGEVSADLTESYKDSAKANGLLISAALDWSTWEVYEYAYDWEENFEIDMSSSFEENATSGFFSITVYNTEKSYDSLEVAYPADAVASFLGDVTTEIPSFTIPEGNTYKVTNTEADDLYGTPASFSISVIDNGVIGTDSLEDTYKAALTSAGYTIDSSKYEEEGYYATSSDNKVSLLFYTFDGVFNLVISLVTE